MNHQFPLLMPQTPLSLMSEDMDHLGHIQAATDHLQARAPQEEVEVEAGNLLSHHNLLPHLSNGHYRTTQHLQRHPRPPAPWVLTAGNVAPYDKFKPKILKEVDDFHGDSNDISRFFQKCELHFSLFNRHFFYPPHKVIFCISQLTGDTQRWWELQSQIIGKNHRWGTAIPHL